MENMFITCNYPFSFYFISSDTKISCNKNKSPIYHPQQQHRKFPIITTIQSNEFVICCYQCKKFRGGFSTSGKLKTETPFSQYSQSVSNQFELRLNVTVGTRDESEISYQQNSFEKSPGRFVWVLLSREIHFSSSYQLSSIYCFGFSAQIRTIALTSFSSPMDGPTIHCFCGLFHLPPSTRSTDKKNQCPVSFFSSPIGIVFVHLVSI